eukprot:903422-Pleurochrysis_carterae.AAC.1
MSMPPFCLPHVYASVSILQQARNDGGYGDAQEHLRLGRKDLGQGPLEQGHEGQDCRGAFRLLRGVRQAAGKMAAERARERGAGADLRGGGRGGDACADDGAAVRAGNFKLADDDDGADGAAAATTSAAAVTGKIIKGTDDGAEGAAAAAKVKRRRQSQRRRRQNQRRRQRQRRSAAAVSSTRPMKSHSRVALTSK